MSEFKRVNDPGNADFENFLRSQSEDVPGSVRDALLFQCGIARGTAKQRRASNIRTWKVSGLVLAAFLTGGFGGTQLPLDDGPASLQVAEPTSSTDTHIAEKSSANDDEIMTRERKPSVMKVRHRPKGLYVGSTEMDFDAEPAYPSPNRERAALQPKADVLRVGHSRQLLDWL